MKKKFPGRPGDWLLHKDNQLVAFNKPAGMPTQPDRQNTANLLQVASAYVRHDLYPVHRLDRPVSGIVLFGQKPSAQTALTEQLKARTVEKTYLAVVGERPTEDSGELHHYLSDARNNNRSVVLDAPAPDAREAILTYRTLGSSERYHLLEIKLITGRKHQIRVQLGELGSPVRGDTKYGFKRANEGGTIDLHGYQLAFDHPISDKRITLTAPVPDTPVWNAFADFL